MVPKYINLECSIHYFHKIRAICYRNEVSARIFVINHEKNASASCTVSTSECSQFKMFQRLPMINLTSEYLNDPRLILNSKHKCLLLFIYSIVKLCFRFIDTHLWSNSLGLVC